MEGSPLTEFNVGHNLIDGYRGENGEIYGMAYCEGDPLFLNLANADFYLGADSPAIGQGHCDNAPQSDYDGAPRCQVGSTCDIVADEFNSGQVYLPVIFG